LVQFVQSKIGVRDVSRQRFLEMPLYTYRCKDHDHEFQVRQRMTDDPITECPVCGGPVRRVVSTVGVVFKGSGFYVTDNRSSNVNGRGSASSKSKESKESKETAGSTEASSTSAPTSSSDAASS